MNLKYLEQPYEPQPSLLYIRPQYLKTAHHKYIHNRFSSVRLVAFYLNVSLERLVFNSELYDVVGGYVCVFVLVLCVCMCVCSLKSFWCQLYHKDYLASLSWVYGQNRKRFVYFGKSNWKFLSINRLRFFFFLFLRRVFLVYYMYSETLARLHR